MMCIKIRLYVVLKITLYSLVSTKYLIDEESLVYDPVRITIYFTIYAYEKYGLN